MANSFLLRIRTTDGAKRIDELTPDSSFKDLKLAIGKLMTVNPNAVSILRGFPPKKLEVSDDGTLLRDLQICHGDCLQVERLEENLTEFTGENVENQGAAPPTTASLHGGACRRGIMTRHTVPSDNSCLFASVDFAMNDGKHVNRQTSIRSMRRLIADSVAADPVRFNAAILDNKSNAEYCRWIVDESSWGGAIELNILSEHLGVEIAVVNSQTGRIDRFGEDANYPHRILLMYDGVHYDPLVLESADGSRRTTMFSTHDDEVMSMAMELGHEAKSSRQFTDVATFRLVCLQCRVIVTGQSGAVQHTKVTGHSNFGEI